eukprot:COSAG02_NODE_62069_length_267_cov_0.553571_1_plen_51_part_01
MRGWGVGWTAGVGCGGWGRVLSAVGSAGTRDADPAKRPLNENEDFMMPWPD